MIRLISKLEKKGTEVKYLDFILQKSIDDLKKEGNSRLDYHMIWKYFDYLKNSRDAIKAVYTLMHVPQMKETAVYLLFVLKKVSEGTITFDTLDENTNEDCDFIKNELVKNFTLSTKPHDEPELQIPEISKSGLSELIKDNKFKIKSEEDASITEEFTEKEMYADEEETNENKSDEELELIKAENNEGDEAYDLPGSKEEIVKETVEEQSEEKTELQEDETEEASEDLTSELSEEVTDSDQELFDTIESMEMPEEKETPAEEELNEPEELYDMPGFEDGFVIKSSTKTEVEEPDVKEQLDEEISEKTYDELSEDDNELKDNVLKEVTDDFVYEKKEDESNEAEKQETEVSEQETEVSEQYKKYETALFEVNELLKGYFLDLEQEKADVESPDGEGVLLAKISELCSMMAGRSDEMSFSVISGIYNDIGDIFNSFIRAGKQPQKLDLEKLLKGLELIESLIKGDDFNEADNVMESIRSIQSSFIDQKAEVEKTEDISGEGEKVEKEGIKDYAEQEKDKTIKTLKEKFSNVELRESYRVLKTQILELEQTFLSLDEIKGDYQNYEGLRTLSSTFINLKEIIRRSKMLDLRESAKLSEASYVFIKFLQNYRMNPFDEDVREILKYIIYNFKLAALDKPRPDIEKFISYLNDPVKIFTQKNQKEKETVDE